MLAKEAGMGFDSHPDGWGYVILADEGRLYNYKSDKPIFEDDHELPRIAGTMHAVFHARHAAEKRLVGPIFCGPYVETTEKEMMFLAHNGRVNMKMMGNDIGYDSSSSIDCELMLKHAAMFGIEESMEALEKYTESALNVIIMTIGRESRDIDIYFKNYYVNKSKKKYYDMYMGKLSSGKAVFSSTLLSYGIRGECVADSKIHLFSHAQGHSSRNGSVVSDT